MIPMFSQDCVDLAKESEGLRLTRYFDPVGIPTIGYGHVVTNGDGALMFVTEAQAEDLLYADLQVAWDAVRRNVKVDLTQGQVDALTDFCFNLGEKNLAHSTLMRLINLEEFEDAALEFDRWVFAQGVKLPGLVIRRARERTLFAGDQAGT